jgi:hypothetical protein
LAGTRAANDGITVSKRCGGSAISGGNGDKDDVGVSSLLDDDADADNNDANVGVFASSSVDDGATASTSVVAVFAACTRAFHSFCSVSLRCCVIASARCSASTPDTGT